MEHEDGSSLGFSGVSKATTSWVGGGVGQMILDIRRSLR